jgi:multicomponent Na+:H+ antiporter subunit D
MIALSLTAMFIASIVAVYEINVKRMLAYSSVAQIGYITLGIGLANQAGLAGGLTHLFNHAIMKAALFLAIGAVFYRIGSCKLDDLAGIGRKMPFTMIAFAIAGFGLIGTPGTAGFISKWYLAIGALDKGWWFLVALIVASSMIAVVYVGRVLEVVWFRPAGPNLKDAKDPPFLMIMPIVAFALATIYFGFDTRLTAGISEIVAKGLIGGLR